MSYQSNAIKLSFLLIFLLNIYSVSAQVTVGSGSYTTTFPGTDSAGRNAFPSDSPQLSGNASGKPVPTNDWWSKLIKENHADNLFNYPMTLKTTNEGLIVTYIPFSQPIGDNKAIVVGLTGLNASKATVSDFSDWTVTMDWNDSSHNLKATSGIGMPFIYFEKDNNDVVEITVNSGNVTLSSEMMIVENASDGADFVIYAPSGSTWSKSGNVYTSSLNSKNYWSMAMLPKSVSNLSVVANEYKKYAYVFPQSTTSSWSYNQSNSKLTTTFSVTTDVKEGTNTNVLLGLLPHQWRNLSSGSANPNGYSYETVRGELKTLNGNTFTVENTFKGILPTLPNLSHYSTGFDPASLNSKISLMENESLATWTDSYNEGQEMNKLIQTARIANQKGNIAARDKLVKTIKERLEDWLSYQSGEVAFLFYYNTTWSTLLGYPSGHGQDNNINDHHFHWGYFIHAAAFMEQFEPGWASKWGDMINLLIRDAASHDRNDSKFPYLRNFSPYAGHSWANGFASFPHGNDQESTSESMQFASSLIHWGTITENTTIRDLGIYIYTTEQTAIEEYWFDIHKTNFQSNQQYSLVSRVWGNWHDNGTFWTSDIAASYGIEMYPIHGGSFYFSHNPTYIQSLWNEITTNTGILSNQENPNLWHDTYWKFLSLISPQSALDLYNSYPNRNLKFGISDAQTYHWLHSMNATGTIDPSITANYPIAVVFKEGNDKTYVAHNYSDSQITVVFSDGFNLIVPANSMATNKDVNVSGTLSADKLELNQNESSNLSVIVNGSGITKVAFYNGSTLLAEDTTAPYEINSGALSYGIHNVYAKVYANTSFNVTNVVSIQVGSQVSYSGTNSSIPGVIEAGHYDTFQGGIGQNIAYYDTTADNKGDFRTSEYVDAVSDVNEGATIGWISGGEWLEYTVDVQTTGCYDLKVRYASGNNNGGGPIYFEIDGKKVSLDIGFPSTGGWNSWNTKTVSNVNLTSGTHVLRLVATGGEVNLAKLTFSYNALECAEVVENTGLPFDFETTPVTADFVNFDGGTGTVEPVASPQSNGNSSSKLAKIVRDGGQPWSGSYINLKDNLDFSSKKFITLKIWTEAPVGTPVQIKLEQQSGNQSSFLKTNTTVSGAWETLHWDFSALGATSFNKLVFMFDIGKVGDGSATSTFYFDDVTQTATLSLENQLKLNSVKVYPNPATHTLFIQSGNIELTNVKIYSLLGKKLLDIKTDLKTVNISRLPKGIYIVKLYSGNNYIIKKVLKK
jgi:endoglucanase Acf2